VVLANLGIGTLTGFMSNAVVFIDRMPADLWVMARGTPNFDMSHSMPESTPDRVKSVRGVLWAEKMLVAWANWQTATGGIENSQVVGLPLGGPLTIPFPVEPAGAGLSGLPGDAIIDRTDQARLMVAAPGESAQLTGRRITVRGFATGMRSFTTNPYVLMRFDDARKSSLAQPGTTSYVLVKAASGVQVAELRNEIQRTLPETDVLTSAEFSRRTKAYWIFGTGLGGAFLLTALLGFVVGGVVVSQVLYSLVQDQRAEFGVLKAMGAGRSVIFKIVAGQAMLIALTGAACGQLLSMGLAILIRAAGSPMELAWGLSATVLTAVLLTCLAAAAAPLLKVLRLEPVVVFRG
jgi:putative ABC transport system permease protein